MQIDKNTPLKSITVQGIEVNVPQPFAEGHTLTAAEAAVLNQTFSENIRNNNRTAFSKAIEDAGSSENVDANAMQKAIDKYVAEYEFGVRRSGGGGGPRLSEEEKFVLNFARQLVRDAIKEQGSVPLKSVSAAQITDIARQKLEEVPAIREKALVAFNAKKENQLSLGELDLSAESAED